MSEHFHAHGAHEHELEHRAHHGPGLAQSVAIFTAILSTAGAVVSYQSAATQSEAMVYKNEAVLKKTQASDQWNFYQAKSTKGHLMELAADLAGPNRRASYADKIAKYEAEKAQIRSEAERLEALGRQADEHSTHLLHPLHRFEQAMTLIQVAISLASITALTRKRWLFVLAGIAAAGGVSLAVLGFLA